MTESNEPTRIGLYGGTFDPIHLGHLILAEEALREAKLDRVCFLPAFSSPLRSGEAETSTRDRLTMVQAAVKGYSRFVVDDFDIRQDRRVYSVETVRHYRKTFPDADLFFLIGRDQYEQLERWHSIEELRKEVTFLCANRGESSSPFKNDCPASTDKGVIFLPDRRIDISSTEIRARLARGESVRSFLPESVAAFLDTTPLYFRG